MFVLDSYDFTPRSEGGGLGIGQAGSGGGLGDYLSAKKYIEYFNKNHFFFSFMFFYY